MERARFMRGVWALFVVLGLGGCASMNRSIESMAASHNEALDQIQSAALLQNILRAADQQPISFTTVSYVSGSGSVGAGASASNSSDGRLFNFITGMSASGSLNINQGFGYSLSSLDNELFTRSFLADIPMDRLHFLSEGTYLDNQVLFTLAIKRLHPLLSSAEGAALIPNGVLAPAWDNFQRVLSRAMAMGLSMEMAPLETPVGPALSRDEATYQMGTVVGAWNPAAWGAPQAGAARPVIKELPRKSADEGRSYQLVMVADMPRFCYSPEAPESWPYGLHSLCQGTGALGRAQRQRNREAGGGSAGGQDQAAAWPLRIDWSMTDRRSPREVFYFLGQIVRSQLDRPGQVWRVGDPSRSSGNRPLFTVVCGDRPPAVSVLAQTAYKGRVCHVPRDDGSHSADVLQYLSLLVTMSKVPGAIPASPGVVIR